MDTERPKSAKARRSPQGMACPLQGLQRIIGRFGALPSGQLSMEIKVLNQVRVIAFDLDETLWP
jgi:hypothetical protein